MGRQAYLVQMALGRSAFQPLPDTLSDEDPAPDVVEDSISEHASPLEESASIENEDGRQSCAVGSLPEDVRSARISQYEQQYDSKGYPENLVSKEMTRQSRRAMNAVLSTVGVCVGLNPEGDLETIQDRSKPSLDAATMKSVKEGNELGFIVDAADMMLLSLAGMFAAGFRQRLQTFRVYAEIRMVSIIRSEWRHFGMLKFFFAGTPASLTYYAFNAARLWTIEYLSLDIFVRLYDNLKSPEHLSATFWLLETAETLLYGASFVVLAPLQVYATLQRLDLLPGWPWAPHPIALIPFSASSPLQMPALPTSWAFGACLKCIASLTVSPLFLWCVAAWVKPQVSDKLRAYIRAGLPKPQYPDRYSIQAARDDELDRDSVPGLCNDLDGDKSEWESANVSEELAKDLQYIGKTFALLYDKCMNFLTRPQNNPTRPTKPRPRAGSIETHVNDLWRAFGFPGSPPPSSFSSTPIPTPTSLPTTPRRQVEISTSIATDGVVDVNLQIPHPTQNEDTSINNPTPPDSEHDRNINDDAGTRRIHRHRPTHRITVLSAYAANALANHLAAHLTDMLFLPLEATIVRSLALSFLSSPRGNPAAQAAAARMRGEVFPLGSWFGMGLRGGWRGMGDYVGKMMLVSGMNVGISMAVWQACTGFAWVSGRRWYKWGNH